MTTDTLASHLADVRIPHEVVDGLLSTSLAGIGDASLVNRLDGDRALYELAVQMVHAILLASTLAQSLGPDADFGTLLTDAPFSGRDESLMLIGRFMFAKITQVEALPDISADLLQDRFAKIYAAI